LDTRAKIISAEDARERLRGQTVEWVAGHFDPLLAEHVRLLGRHASPNRLLVVEITDPDRPLLGRRARAELVAALTMVDYVVLKNGGAATEAPMDAGVTEHFMERVLQRHRAKGTG
jgi:bifunctional ADP-heptose synthase (sugar kinase/adenylyltransferase)